MVVQASTGLIIGVCVVFLGVAVTLMLSFFNASSFGIPLVIEVWTTEENGGTAVNFQPNLVGMVIAVLLIAVVYAVHPRSRMRVDVVGGRPRGRTVQHPVERESTDG